MQIKNYNLKSFLEGELKILEEKNLLRKISDYSQNKLINFSSNDYLGLAEGKVSPAEVPPHDIGSSGSRLTTGTHPIHLELEQYVCEWKKTEAALVFSSGYLANTGAIAALMGPQDVIFSDELNHACIFDGIRLSGAKKFFYKHNDTGHLKELLETHRQNYQKAMVITDSVFSMDGDKAKLDEIVFLKKFFDFFIYVDEAHGSGILGTNGSGLVEELTEKNLIQKEDIEIQMGTFSKAIGVEGAYIAGSKKLIDFLLNSARTFMFSTAPSPFICSLILKNLKTAIDKAELRAKLHENILYTRNLLEAEHLQDWSNDGTAIFAVFVGDIEKTLSISNQLVAAGFLVLGIRPPTVTSPRLRICISAKHSKEDISKLIKTISQLMGV